MTETKQPTEKSTPIKKNGNVSTKNETSTSKSTTKKTTNTEELMKKHQSMILFIQNRMEDIENEMKRIKLTLHMLSKFDPNNPESIQYPEEQPTETWTQETEENIQVIEGIFDGYFMVDASQKKYPVPLNYSSKTKLVPGDHLKLKILEDGKFIYKLIQPVERKHTKAILSKNDDNKFIAITEDGKNYFLNQAAVTFFKGKVWDELYILINEKEDMPFAAIEAIIKK